MKTIVIGYKDAAGLTKPIVLAAPDVDSQEQFSGMSDAQNRHEFPKGIQRMELFVLDEPAQVAQFISDEVANFAQQSDDKRITQVEKDRAQAKLERDSADNIKKVNQMFGAAASARNVAISAVAAQRNIIASESVSAADKEKAQAKIDGENGLQFKADAAAAAFKKVLDARAILLNPKSTPDEKTGALVSLGIIKQETAQQPSQK